MGMIKDLGNGRRAFVEGGLFEVLRDGCLKAGDFIDVVAGTVRLIVDPFQNSSQNVVTATASSGNLNSPMQVIECHLDNGRVTGRNCVSDSEEDKHYHKVYWGASSG